MFTNKTKNLDLPQWIGSDKANWDIDLNYAFKQISDYVDTLNEKFTGIDSTDGQFDSAIKEINKNIETINATIDSINEVDGIQSADITDLKEKVTKLQTDVSDLTTSSTDLTQRIQTIENELPPIQQSITTLTQNYNSVENKVLHFLNSAKITTLTVGGTTMLEIPYNTEKNIDTLFIEYCKLPDASTELVTSLHMPTKMVFNSLPSVIHSDLFINESLGSFVIEEFATIQPPSPIISDFYIAADTDKLIVGTTNGFIPFEDTEPLIRIYATYKGDA